MVSRGRSWKKKDRRATGGRKNWREGDRKEPAETNNEKSVFVKMFSREKYSRAQFLDI